MKIMHKAILSLVALGMLACATPSQARWFPHVWIGVPFYHGPYYSYYYPYYGPYYGYSYPYYGGVTFGFGGHWHGHYYGHGGHRR